MRSELSKRLDMSRKMEQYDEHCKNILADKRLLAWIMNGTMKEFHSMQIDDILQYIEGKPAVSSIPADPGMTNLPVIRGSRTEERIPNEGVVFFDICFQVALPAHPESGLIIDLEAQREMRPGYSIVTRGIFYGARLLSAQMGTEFTAPDYDKIKKVFSVWICFHSPEYIGNAVCRYHLQKEDLVPGLPDFPEEYDKLEVILICLHPRKENPLKLTELLNLIFNSRRSFEEKAEILGKEFGFPMETDFGREFQSMCNVSEYILEQALEEGMERGIQQGIQRGIQQGMERGLQRGIERGVQQGRWSQMQEIIRKMLEEHFPDEQILKICGITAGQLEEIKRERL